MSGWRRMPRQSESSSLPPRSMTRSESANLPMSCSRPAVWASSCSRRDIPSCSARSRENAATAAQWRAARESRSSSVRTRLDSTPHDRFAYSRVRSRATTTSRSMYVNAMTLRATNASATSPNSA